MNSIWQIIRRREYWADFARTFLPFWVAFNATLFLSTLGPVNAPSWMSYYYLGGTGLMLVIALYSAWYQVSHRDRRR